MLVFQVSDLVGPKKDKSSEEAELMELMRKPFVKVLLHSVCACIQSLTDKL